MTADLTPKESLFETRGGSLMAHCCEVCADPLPHDSLSPICEDCARGEAEDDV